MRKTGMLILANFALSLLVSISVIEVYQTITDIIHAMATVNAVLFTASLAAALVPSAFVIFWGGNAITIQLKPAVGAMYRYFCNQGSEKSFSQGNRRSDD